MAAGTRAGQRRAWSWRGRITRDPRIIRQRLQDPGSSSQVSGDPADQPVAQPAIQDVAGYLQGCWPLRDPDRATLAVSARGLRRWWRQLRTTGRASAPAPWPAAAGWQQIGHWPIWAAAAAVRRRPRATGGKNVSHRIEWAAATARRRPARAQRRDNCGARLAVEDGHSSPTSTGGAEDMGRMRRRSEQEAETTDTFQEPAPRWRTALASPESSATEEGLIGPADRSRARWGERLGWRPSWKQNRLSSTAKKMWPPISPARRAGFLHLRLRPDCSTWLFCQISGLPPSSATRSNSARLALTSAMVWAPGCCASRSSA